MPDFTKIKTIPIKSRKNKFNIQDIVSLKNSALLIESDELKILADKIKEARRREKQIILMMGAHPIKLGFSLFIIDLLKKGFITHIAMNGAGAIHDFELAMIGATSEDVAKNLENGTFGMAYETGHYLNLTAGKSAKNNSGLGKEIGKMIYELNLEYKDFSILYSCYQLKIPVTIHTAIGTEIIYQHPECNAEALGKSSYEDFKILTESISKLEKGVVINLGSAVILPEVFLKAFTIARNLKFKIEDFTAANFDMLDHYRPRVNVLQRPTSKGGKSFSIIEKHEKTIPSLHYLLNN